MEEDTLIKIHNEHGGIKEPDVNDLFDQKLSLRDQRVYVGDLVVHRSSNKNLAAMNICYGIVAKISTRGTSTDNTSEDSKGIDSEYTGSEDQLGKPTIYVKWSLDSGDDITKHSDSNELTVVDRSIGIGMLVENQNGRRGVVYDTRCKVDVALLGSEFVLENISAERLKAVTNYARGQEILYQEWIGSIKSVKNNIWFRFDNGPILFVEKVEDDGFQTVDPYWGNGFLCPGMRLFLAPKTLRKAHWLTGIMRCLVKWVPPVSYYYSLMSVTITRIEVVSIEVEWTEQAPFVGRDRELPVPPSILHRHKLEEIEFVGTPCFETIQLNSVRLLDWHNQDDTTIYEEWFKKFNNRYRSRQRLGEINAANELSSSGYNQKIAQERGSSLSVKVILRQNIVDVQWDDNSRSELPAARIYKIMECLNDPEFPTGLVVAPAFKNSSLPSKYGIVLDSSDLVSKGQRRVLVKWLVEGGMEVVSTESVYNLRPHPHFSMYQRGTIVSSRNLIRDKFRVGFVSDTRVADMKMILKFANRRFPMDVYPHSVIPISRRLIWDFATKSWLSNDAILPPFQLDVEFSWIKQIADDNELSLVPVANNNSNDKGALSLKSIWDTPGFEMISCAPESHRYFKGVCIDFPREYSLLMNKEILSMQSFLPEGIWVRCYENRMDLLSVLFVGPSRTPYEDGLFMFEMQLPPNLNMSIPKVHYVAYSPELNPLMSWDGNFCISALKWDPTVVKDGKIISNFLETLQSLIFTSEPYLLREHIRTMQLFNDAPVPEKLRSYNEGICIRVLDSLWNASQNPIAPWEKEIRAHIAHVIQPKIANAKMWGLLPSKSVEDTGKTLSMEPNFLLLPVSKGFTEALSLRLSKFHKIIPTGAKVPGFESGYELVPKISTTPKRSLSDYIPPPTCIAVSSDSALRSPHTDKSRLGKPSFELDSLKNIKKNTSSLHSNEAQSSNSSSISSKYSDPEKEKEPIISEILEGIIEQTK